MRRLSPILVCIALALIPALVSAPSQPAQACINGVRADTNAHTQMLVTAAKNLDAGRLAAAFRLSLKVERELRREGRPPTDPTVQKAARISALSVIRSGGKVGGKDLSVNAAAHTLLRRWERDTDDPGATSEYAEALMLDPTSHDKALELLADLEQRDLVPTPFAWRALATLRTEKGDADGAAKALARCRASATAPALCDAPTASRT